jgi:hypothetical protein
MLAAHGESQRDLLSNGCASLRDAVRAGSSILANPRWQWHRPFFTQSKKGHLNDLRKRRCAPLRVLLGVTARQWCNIAQATIMVPSQ